ncbi:MAG: hypothetical protein WAS73_01125 [Defluviicoccus sp.]
MIQPDDRGSPSNTTAAVLAAYRGLRTAKDAQHHLGSLPDFRIAGLETIQPVGSACCAPQCWLQTFNPDCGWLRFQSQVVSFRSAGTSSWPSGQRLLYGEVAAGAAKSASIRPDGRGGLRVFRYEETGGDDYLVERVNLIASDKGLGNLNYDIYWEIGKQGARPVIARFVGFDVKQPGGAT